MSEMVGKVRLPIAYSPSGVGSMLKCLQLYREEEQHSHGYNDLGRNFQHVHQYLYDRPRYTVEPL